MTALYINAGLTVLCLVVLGVYFNYRERKIHSLANVKIKELQEKYRKFSADKNAEESEGFKILKGIAAELEEEYRKLKLEKKNLDKNSEKKESTNSVSKEEAEKILAEAKKKADEIIEVTKKEAEKEKNKYLTAQKKEIESKIVDLVIAITKKLLVGGLDYSTHKKMIEESFMEMEGKLTNEKS